MPRPTRLSRLTRLSGLAVTRWAVGLTFTLCAALFAGLCAGCSPNKPSGASGAGVKAASPSTDRADAAPHAGAPRTTAPARAAVAAIHGAGEYADKIAGRVTFTQSGDGVRVVADVTGLTPGKHGFHIHESPDLSAPDLKSAGPHFNPDGTKHGGPHTVMRHAGDLGNLTADDQGHAALDQVIDGISVNGPDGKIVGHSVVVHAGEDDLKTDPAGNSGPRIAAGVIEEESTQGPAIRP